MITIINKYTGEVITKYSGALVSESDVDSCKGFWYVQRTLECYRRVFYSSERVECNTMPS